MGNLSEAARNGFRKAGGGAYVPEWYKLSVGIGTILIFLILVINAVLSQKITNDTLTPNNQPSTTIIKENDDSNISLPNESVPSRDTNGKEVYVSKAALDTATLAGLAIWNGDWDGVPVSGELGMPVSTFPEAIVGKSRVISASSTMASFLFSLDKTGDGKWDQSFQITVINDGSGWVYPLAIG